MANELVQQVTGAVRRAPSSRRWLLLGGVIVLGAAVAGVAMWASDPTYVVLYRDMTLGETGRMTEVLDQAGIRNRLGPDGSEILVAKSDHAKARVLLAKAQLPMNGRPGFELFEQKQDWGMTDFTQRITYQRALEGELARTIGGTVGVERAEVHLTIPEPGALRRTDRPAKAAVLLKMRAGMTLAPGAVQGIVATVSNSVDRLSPENIAITDDSGRLLSGPAEDATSLGAATKRIEIQKSIEDYLGQKAERLLAAVAGLGQPRVQVSAQLNFDQVERTIEQFDPDGQVLQNEGRSETEAPADGSSGGAQTIINNTYQNSRKLEKIVSGGSGVTRLTVAVLVNERTMAQDTTSTTPTAQRLANVEALVKNAIGFDSTRGDRITVTAVPIEVPAIDTSSQAVGATPPRDTMSLVERFVRPAIGLVAIVVLLLLALRTIKAMGAPAAAGWDAEAMRSNPSLAGAELPPLGPPPESVLLKNKVVEETQNRPELMAQVVRAWMSEGGSS